MNSKEWISRHIEHAEYNRDAWLASADSARLRFRAGKRYQDYREWKDCIRQAWAMRRIVKSSSKLSGSEF